MISHGRTIGRPLAKWRMVRKTRPSTNNIIFLSWHAIFLQIGLEIMLWRENIVGLPNRIS